MKQAAMKKILLMTMAFLLMAIASVAKAATGTLTYSATYDYNRLSVGTAMLAGQTYTTVKYNGLFNDGALGTPFLPVDYIRFSVPWNATGFSVSAILDDNRIEYLDHEIYPCQSFNPNQTATLPDSVAYYGTLSGFPSLNAWIDGEVMMAGENHVVTVAVMPISCLHNRIDGGFRCSLRFSGTVRLTLSYELSDTTPMFPLIRRDTTLRNKGFEETRQMVVNPSDVSANACAQFQLRNYPDVQIEPDGTPATYLIIATPQSLHPMRRLAALRKQKGLNVKLVTVDEAINDTLAGEGDLVYEGNDSVLASSDDTGKLRQYLRMHYYYLGTEHILLAGTGVPFFTKGNGQADMYFSDLNVNWNSLFDNGGELNVGRLLGTRSCQFDDYTDKVFRYELNPGNRDLTYLQNALFTGLDKYGSVEYEIEEIAEYCPYTTFMYASQGYSSPTGNDVINTINNEHFGFISSFNDGTPSYILTQTDENGGTIRYLWAIDTVKVAPSFSDSETDNGLNRMVNKYYPSIYFSGIGQTMPYNRVSGYNIDVNYGESFTMGKEYGGPVYMGLTDNIFNSAIMYLGRGLVSSIKPGRPLGIAYKNARQLVPYDHFKPYDSFSIDTESLVSCHNYLGDPLIEMWTCLPQTYSGITVTRTDNSINVVGLPVGAQVSYCDNTGKLGMTQATASSVTFNQINPNSTIMVYDSTHLPYIARLVLQNTTLNNSQYVIANDVTIGRQAESSRTFGDVTVSDDACYEIESAGKVTIEGGFNVELGASFAIYTSSYK